MSRTIPALAQARFPNRKSPTHMEEGKTLAAAEASWVRMIEFSDEELREHYGPLRLLGFYSVLCFSGAVIYIIRGLR